MRGASAAKRVAASGAVAAASSLAGLAAAAVAHVVLARCLSVEGYGFYNYFVATASLAAALSLLGLDAAAPVVIGRERGCARLVLKVGAMVLAATAPLASGFALLSLRRADETPTVIAWVLVASVLLLSLTQLVAAVGRGLLGLRQKVLQDVAPRATLLALILAAVACGGCSLEYAVSAYTLSLAAAAAFVAFTVLSRVKRVEDSCSVAAGRVLGEALALYTAALAAIALSRSDTYMLGVLSSLSQVALYSAAALVAKTAGMVFENFGYTYLPLVAGYSKDGDVARLYRDVALVAMTVSLPPVLAAAALAPHILSRLFGEAYAAATPVLEALAAGYFAHILSGYNGMTLMAMGESRLVARIAALVAAANIALNAMLIPLLGALGAALATAAALLTQNLLLNAALAAKLGRLPHRDPLLASTAVLYAAASLAAIAAGLTRTPWLAAAAAAAYLAGARRALRRGLLPPLRR